MYNKLKIIIGGGAGFVGSSLAIYLKQNFDNIDITIIDNLSRYGSKLNLSRFKKNNIKFIFGDLSKPNNLKNLPKADFFIDAAANPSTLAGINSSATKLIDDNFISTINCVEWSIKNNCKLIFLSTSRVYPFDKLRQIPFDETASRFKWNNKENFEGLSENGISEKFNIDGLRSFYGTSKYVSENFIREYGAFKNLKYVINRCGVIGGPWQMGKVDQGILAYWVAAYHFNKPLHYLGYNGMGKQVRDIVHILDICKLIETQIFNWDKVNSQIFNVGGGLENSISLFELSRLVQKETKIKKSINNILENRLADIPIYVTDNSKVNQLLGWEPSISLDITIKDTYRWVVKYRNQLKEILF